MPFIPRKIGAPTSKDARCIIAVAGLVAFALICAHGTLQQSSSEILFFSQTDNLTRLLSIDNSQPLYLRAKIQNSYGQYKPIDCPSLLRKARTKGNEHMDPNQGYLHGKQIDMDPKFWISLHNKSIDVTRWDIMKTGNYYERKLSQAFQEVLLDAATTKTPSRVIDVGGNIGFFTLLSAANGPVVVDTFEPNTKNSIRLCESLALNDWHGEFDPIHNHDCPGCASATKEAAASMVNVYPFGVGRKEGILSFIEHDVNPGQGVFTEVPPSLGGTGLQVVTLDNFAMERGWFQTRPDIAILKVDVEGMEYTVIEGGLKLFQAKIVRNIFMEVSARDPEEIEANKPGLRLLQQNGYILHRIGGWEGPNVMVDFPQDENIADPIMTAAEKEFAKQLNLWWKLPA